VVSTNCHLVALGQVVLHHLLLLLKVLNLISVRLRLLLKTAIDRGLCVLETIDHDVIHEDLVRGRVVLSWLGDIDGLNGLYV
jgi:hypothetical protein